MTTNKFSISEALKFGWKTTTENFWFFVQVVLILFGIQLVSNYIISTIPDEMVFMGFALSLIFLVVQLIIDLGIIAVTIKLVDGQKTELKDIFSIVKPVGTYIAAAILSGILVLLGLIVFIIPGIIIGIAIQFFPYFIVDKGAGVIDSLKHSAEITKGERLKLFGFMILSTLIVLAGALLFGIGLLWAVPTVMMAMAYIYRKLDVSGVEGGLVLATDMPAPAPTPSPAPTPVPTASKTSELKKDDAKPASDLPPNVPAGTKTDPEPTT